MRRVLRTQPARRRAVLVTGLSAALVLAGAITLLIPLATPAPVVDQASWQLDTGSRLAYVHLRPAGRSRPAPVVVLHGGPGIPNTAADIAPFAPLTRLGFDVYSYDQLGAGGSSRLADPASYGVDRDVADLEAIRRTIGADTMVLIGHSYGATLAAHYLAAHPDHVQQLVLVSPGALDPTDTSASGARTGLDTAHTLHTYAAVLAPRALLGYTLLQLNPAAAHAYLGDPEADTRNDAVLTLTEPALHCPSARPQPDRAPVQGSGFYALQYPQSATAAPPADPRPALTGLRTPTLILKGSCDYLSWHSVTDYRATLARTTLLYLPGAGHNLGQDRPDILTAATSAFLTNNPPPLPPYTSHAAPSDYRGPLR